MKALYAVPILTLFALTLVGCGGSKNRPELSTQGLHQFCPDAGTCTEGQECVEAAGPGGPTHTCEIRCANDGDCPSQTSCNLPPVVPDSIPNTCQ